MGGGRDVTGQRTDRRVEETERSGFQGIWLAKSGEKNTAGKQVVP